jgi:hypothetical protein
MIDAVEIDGREFVPVPESWIASGEYFDDRGFPIQYATGAAVDDGDVVVRYVHPRNSEVVAVRFAAIDGDGGAIPEVLADERADWPASLHMKPDLEPSGVVRYPERQWLRDRHGEYLREHTAYDPDAAESARADGGDRNV